MRANHVKRRLAAGEPSVGTWLSLPTPEGAEYIGGLGFDWLVVDTEHSPIDIRTLALMFAALSASASAPMVRIPWNTLEHFKRALDSGAWGVVVPMVNSTKEAEQAVAAMRYPPQGSRSVGGGRFARGFDTTADQYFEHAGDELLLVVQIEHIRGVEAADAILAVPGVGACFIGPNDLAASMGIGIGVPLECDDPRLAEPIDTCAARLRPPRCRAGHPLLGRRGGNAAPGRGLPVLCHGQRSPLHAERPAVRSRPDPLACERGRDHRHSGSRQHRPLLAPRAWILSSPDVRWFRARPPTPARGSLRWPGLPPVNS